MTPTSTNDEQVRAAGGLIWREGPGGAEVVLIHRPAYDDWSFPKGKLDPGEGFRDAALREINEETSLRCQLGADLGSVTYDDSMGRPKIVRYWRARVIDGELQADNEVDEALWVPVDDARALLSYQHDRDLLDRCIAMPVLPDATLLLIRHAKAGDRSRWDGPDELRPLSKPGRRQAEGLVEAIGPAKPSAIISSPFVRCVETVQPLADASGLDVDLDARLAEGSSTEGVLALARASAAAGIDTVAMCSHGDVIMDVIEDLQRDDVPIVGGEPTFAKGSWWEIEFRDGAPAQMRSKTQP